MPEPAYRFEHPVHVRFRDVDIGGHAHHSEALVYFEEARAAYWRDVVGRPGLEDIDYVLADAHVRFHRRILYPDVLTVYARVSLLGAKHFVMDYLIRSSAGDRLVSGRTTQVMYDYAEGASKRVPAEVRERIEEFDAPATRGKPPPMGE